MKKSLLLAISVCSSLLLNACGTAAPPPPHVGEQAFGISPRRGAISKKLSKQEVFMLPYRSTEEATILIVGLNGAIIGLDKLTGEILWKH